MSSMSVRLADRSPTSTVRSEPFAWSIPGAYGTPHQAVFPRSLPID